MTWNQRQPSFGLFVTRPSPSLRSNSTKASNFSGSLMVVLKGQ